MTDLSSRRHPYHWRRHPYPSRPAAPDQRPRLPLYIWILFHAGLLIALGLSVLLLGPVRVNTDLFDIIPAARSLKAVAAADRALGGRNSREVIILAGHPDFAQAKKGAELLYSTFAGNSNGTNIPGNAGGVFESLSLFVDETVMAQFTGYLHRYRYMLLDAETRRLLESGGASAIAAGALGSAFGAFNFASMDYLETDPFFLTERGIRQFLSSSLLSGGAMSLRDDVLAAAHEGTWYVMIRGALASRGVSLTNEDSGVEKIYAACNSIAMENPGLAFAYSGVPFHSYASSSSAQKEISLISTITIAIIILLFLYIFRSPLPVIVSVFAAGISILTAVVSALLFFREVHILTFVFGTTLIGTCVDYSIHYFIHWKGNGAVKSGGEIRSLIFRGIALSFVSTAICFIVLLCAPFVILRQFAVFSLCGLSSSFLTVSCLYPRIKMFKGERKLPAWKAASGGKESGTARRHPYPLRRHPYLSRRMLKKALLFSIPAVSLVLLFINRDSVRVENNIRSLYAMPEFLAESEKTSAAVLDHGSTGWYFIVSGSDPEETLEREELLVERLKLEIARGKLGSYLGTSVFIPSIKTQKRNFEAAGELAPLAEEQFKNLGFPPEAAAAFLRDYGDAREQYAVPGGDIPPYIGELVSKLWIGRADGMDGGASGMDGGAGSMDDGAETQGAYYSCVLPLHASNEDEWRRIAGELEGVYFINKVKDTEKELDALTKIMLLLFFAAYALIAVMVKIFYPWKKAFRIYAIPFLLTVVTLTVLACLDITLGFFSAVALILIFGLGLDYMFYIMESEKHEGQGDTPQDFRRSLTVLAISLSFVTTALSFGALALSSFVPVHIFGLTVFSGLSAAFISAMLIRDV